MVVPSSVDATGVEEVTDETDANELGHGLGDAGTETDTEVGATLLFKQAVQTVEVEVNV